MIKPVIAIKFPQTPGHDKVSPAATQATQMARARLPVADSIESLEVGVSDKGVKKYTKPSRRGGMSSLLVVFMLLIVGMIPTAVIIEQNTQRLRAAEQLSLHSEGVAVIRYYAKLAKNHVSWKNTLNATGSTVNAAVQNYFVNHPAGAAPHPCPRQEQCGSTPPTFCSAPSPPPCDPPSPEQPIDIYDMSGAKIIDNNGSFINSNWQSVTTAAAARWQIRATWTAEANYQVHLHFYVTYYSGGSPKSPTISLIQPVKFCVVQQKK